MRKACVCIACLALSSSLLSCASAPLVKTDLESLSANPAQYEGKRVIVTTDVRSLIEKPEDYWGRKVEVTGYVEINGLRRSGDWEFILRDDEGRSVKCYEWKYRVESWILPSMALRRAASENGQVTVVGKVEKDLEIELDWIEYKDEHYDTDYIPYTAFRRHHYYYGYGGAGGYWY